MTELYQAFSTIFYSPERKQYTLYNIMHHESLVCNYSWDRLGKNLKRKLQDIAAMQQVFSFHRGQCFLIFCMFSHSNVHWLPTFNYSKVAGTVCLLMLYITTPTDVYYEQVNIHGDKRLKTYQLTLSRRHESTWGRPPVMY